MMAMVNQLAEDEIPINTSEDDFEHLENSNSQPSSQSSVASKRNSPLIMPALQYTKDDLMKYSRNFLSQNWPSCLDSTYNNATGKWDPERWFMNHRSDRNPPSDEPRVKRDRQDDGIIIHKRKSSDPKERLKEEKDDIVLSPQRRSFGTGCHVIQQSSLARRPNSPVEARESESFRDSSRRIGSGRIMARDQREWERDRDYGYTNRGPDRRDRFDQDDCEKDARRYSSRYSRGDRRGRGRDRIDEVEPEWFSGGPTSQSDTIELVGFEDQQSDDTRTSSKKNYLKKTKQISQKSSLKSDEGEKMEPSGNEDNSISHNVKHPGNDFDSKEEGDFKNCNENEEDKKTSGSGFDLDDLFRMEWIPGLLQNETPPDNVNEIGCSRFSQWFNRESPLLNLQESANNSRRSSLQEEFIANVLNSIGEPQLLIPSPTPNPSERFFTPISPMMPHSSSRISEQTHSTKYSSSKEIMDMLQCVNANNDTFMNGECLGKGFKSEKSVKTVQELEDDLKRIVLGGNKQQHEDRSAFDKLVLRMSDSHNSLATSMSIGPLDKSKALQEKDLLKNILNAEEASASPPFSVPKEEKQIVSGTIPLQQMPSTVFQPKNRDNSDIQGPLVYEMQEQAPLAQQIHQSTSANVQGFSVDMLAKMFGTSNKHALNPASPVFSKPGITPPFHRNEAQMINSVLQYQRQRELLSSFIKQQQSSHNFPQPNLLQPSYQPRIPSAKEMTMQQTLGLPSLSISPQQSPLPPEIMGSALTNQGRIPSPLIFGQQPPALSHAPAPIHPAHITQAMAQSAANSNNLQVQNSVVLQRVPSPQELAVHTQSILQNALIKRKLEEQKENFRKRTNSPVKNGTTSPSKGLSPTIAFTPTSVMRKMQSEKAEFKEQKKFVQQNGGTKIAGAADLRSQDCQNVLKPNSIGISSSTTYPNFMPLGHCQSASQSSCHSSPPRAVQGQASNSALHRGINSPLIVHNQGRPIVKLGAGHVLNVCDSARSGSGKPVTHNKQYMQQSSSQTHVPHEVNSNFDTINKPTWQHSVGRQQNSSIPNLHNATALPLGHRPTNINPHHVNMLRPVGVASVANVSASNMNFFRNMMQNPAIRGQLATMQLRGPLDAHPIQAMAQSQRIHPAALQQLLMSSQNQIPVGQGQIATGLSDNRDIKHQHLIPGHATSNRQSPINLTKWFGNDVLKQKMPEMPPSTQQRALLLEEVEKQQQQSTVIHT